MDSRELLADLNRAVGQVLFFNVLAEGYVYDSCNEARERGGCRTLTEQGGSFCHRSEVVCSPAENKYARWAEGFL